MSIKTNIKLDTKLGEPSKEFLALPFASMLPSSEVELLKWRLYIHTRCLTDLEFRRDVYLMCKRDVVFFAATFAWCHETRSGEFTRTEGKFPFVPWNDQCDILAWLQMYGGVSDITIEKTRGIGLSWVATIYLLWKWLFSEGGGIEMGVLSKDNDSLDVLGRPSTLMGKLDVLFANLPAWLRFDSTGKTILKRTSSQTHQFTNLMNGNAILGYTSSDEKLRSARLYLIIVDEAAFLEVDVQRWLAASQFVSNSRIFISTHNGTLPFFHRLTTDAKSMLVRISTWWWNNTARAAGRYVVKNGQVELLDPDYDYRDYEFIFDDPGTLRSPWLDSQFRKPGIDVIRLKQELFGVAAIDSNRMIEKRITEMARETCKPPVFRARYDHGDFIEDLEGDFFFWQDFSFTSSYYLGVDPALGAAGAALGALVAIDAKTGAVVAAAGFRDMNSVDLAQQAVYLAERLCGPRGQGYCQIVPESTGIGFIFMTELKRLRWHNVYNEGKGVHNTDRGEKILTEYGRAIRDGDAVALDLRIIEDLEHFEYDSRMQIQFTGQVGHGDLAMAAALSWWGARDVRRRILDTESQLWRNGGDKQPIELEPGYATRKSRKREGWSQRFAIRK